jgi:hypothetical protein
MDAFALETGEEVFCDGVVVGVAFAGHALADAMLLQRGAESVGGVLKPRSEWKMRPCVWRWRLMAIFRASRVSFVSIRSP